MTHYYLYIEAAREIDESAKLYKVAVGTSTQANRDYLFLTAFAVSHNYYFQLWSTDVADFAQRLYRSVPNLSSMIGTTARDLVRAIKHGERPTAKSHHLANENRLLDFISTNHRVISRLNRHSR